MGIVLTQSMWTVPLPDDCPPAIREWAYNNISHYAPANQTYTDTTKNGQALGMYVFQATRSKYVGEFLNDWSTVVLNGTDAQLRAAIKADPVVAQQLQRYQASVGKPGTTDFIDFDGTNRGKTPAFGKPITNFTQLRAFMRQEVLDAQAVYDKDIAAMNAFIADQKRRAQSSPDFGSYADRTWLVEPIHTGPNDDAEVEEQMRARLAMIEQIQAQIAARLAAGLPLDLTNGTTYSTLRFEAIYPNGYDPAASGRVAPTGDLYGRTPSAAGTSPSAGGISMSALGMSLSAAGISLSAAGAAGMPGQGDPYFRVSAGDTTTMYSPFIARPLADTNPDLAMQLYGPLWSRGGRPLVDGLYATAPNRSLYLSRYDMNGRLSALTNPSSLVGFLDDQNASRLIANGDIRGLSRLLAQPFNVLITWGAGLTDLDLHMTGPGAADPANRFHIYYAARGDQATFPFAELITDCICASGSEAILTTRLQTGGVYRISAFNFGNQSTTSNQLSTLGEVVLKIVRGGQAVQSGQGTTIVGGRTIFSGSPTPGAAGNTWTAVEINPSNGAIYFANQIGNSENSANVP
jgi:hypothetical protein